jgi:hypothetical protein
MELPRAAVLVTEIDGFRAGGPGYSLRFHQDVPGDRWFVDFWPLWCAAVHPQDVHRFIRTCLTVLKRGMFEESAQFFDDGHVSGSVIADANRDDAGTVWLAVDLNVDFRQDLVGHDAKGRPLYRDHSQTVSFWPGCRFESHQDRDRLLRSLRMLRARLDGLDDPDPPDGTVFVAEFDDFFSDDRDHDRLGLRFHHDEAGDRWFVSLSTEKSICEPVTGFPVRSLPVTRQGLRRFTDAYRHATTDPFEIPAETLLLHYYDHRIVLRSYGFKYDETNEMIFLEGREVDLLLYIECGTGSEFTGRSPDGEPLFSEGKFVWSSDSVSLQDPHSLLRKVTELRDRLDPPGP